MKDAYYFPHDYEPASDPKMMALLGKYGAVGYGIFWRIVEMLHSDSNHKLPLKDYIFNALGSQLIVEVEKVKEIISYCIESCELFKSDGEYFWSNRALKNIDKRREISEIRSEAGRIGAIAKQKKANAKQTVASVQQNEAKERKGKEKKGEEIKGTELSSEKSAPDFPSNGYRKELVAEYIRGFKKNPGDYELKAIADYVEQFGRDTLKRNMRAVALRGIKSVQYFLDNIDGTGNLIPFKNKASPKRFADDDEIFSKPYEK